MALGSARKWASTDGCSQAKHAQEQILAESQGWERLILIHPVVPFPKTSSTKGATVPYSTTTPDRLPSGWNPQTEILRWEEHNPQLRDGATEVQSE